MNDQPLHYYIHDGPAAFRFELAGYLDHEGARGLTRDWRAASSAIGDRSLIVDISFVTGVDEQGRALLAGWQQAGALFVANSKASRLLAESILGQPLPESAPDKRTWLPFRGLHSALLLLVLALLLPAGMEAATLKSETIAAWGDYLRAVNENLQNRVRPGGAFLWTFENAQRTARVHNGEMVVAPVPGQNPKKVPDGLIHHWIGAMFLPNLKLDETLEITRDYDRYKEFYRPSVMESKTIVRNGPEDTFSMVLMNKAFFLRTALDADYHATNVRLDDYRFYSITRSTRVQEAEEYAQPGEHRMPEGEGGGYIWKLYSIARFAQRDGGVYVEIEAIALSRDVPFAVRFVVDPIMRRVSRNSLLISLRQTEEAVQRNCAGISSTAGQSGSVSASLPDTRSAFTSVH